MMGAIPESARCFAVLALGGNGAMFSRIGAEVIRTLLTGKEDPDADLFALPSA